MTGALSIGSGHSGFDWFWGHTYTLGGLVVLGVAVVFVLVKFGHRRQTYSELAEDFGLYGVVGKMGGGKTYLLAWMGCRGLQAGRVVGANFDLSFGGARARRLDSWADVLAMPRGSLILLHEMHLCWPVNVTKGPPGVQQWATQLRKRTITVLWDSQYWTQTSLMFRKLTFRVWVGERWYRGHVYRLFESFDYSKRNIRAQCLATMWVKRRPEVMAGYDTKEIAEGFGAWWEKGYEGPGVSSARESWSATDALALALLAGRPPPLGERTGPGEAAR